MHTQLAQTSRYLSFQEKPQGTMRHIVDSQVLFSLPLGQEVDRDCSIRLPHMTNRSKVRCFHKMTLSWRKRMPFPRRLLLQAGRSALRSVPSWQPLTVYTSNFAHRQTVVFYQLKRSVGGWLSHGPILDGYILIDIFLALVSPALQVDWGGLELQHVFPVAALCF